MVGVINGVSIVEPIGFAPRKSIVRAGEMVNGLGQTIGDYVRTKYVLNYKFEALPATLMSDLVDALDPETYDTFSVTHSSVEGDYTGTYRVIEPLQGEKLIYNASDGAYMWGNVTMTLEEV